MATTNSTEPRDRLQEVLAQLDALLTMASDGFEAFNALSQNHKDDYLANAVGLTRVARNLAQEA